MSEMAPGRWPPAYDADQFRENIKKLAESVRLEDDFYEKRAREVPFAQGDILRLGARFPFISGSGTPAARDLPDQYWMIAGNTCDMCRDEEDAPTTLVVPIKMLGPLDSLTANEVAALKRYQYARQFYVPPWGNEVADQAMVAELLEMATIERQALKPELVVAKLSYAGWALFHSCMVRFLARDDGRYDPG